MSAPKHTAGLDTSGYVQCPAPDQKPNETTGCWFWSDLSPFTQGYIEELLRSIGVDRFDALAPETLARIIRDCEQGVDLPFMLGRAFNPNEAGGRCFWADRQAGYYASFQPLTVQLGDDGKVRFAKAMGVSQ